MIHHADRGLNKGLMQEPRTISVSFRNWETFKQLQELRKIFKQTVKQPLRALEAVEHGDVWDILSAVETGKLRDLITDSPWAKGLMSH